MGSDRVLSVLIAICGAFLTASAHGQEAEAHAPGGAALDWMEKAYGDGRHNAFTDLIRWNGMYYLCFRHGEAHGSMDGVIRVMRSPDMRTWESCGQLATLGDDRDPHFALAGDTLHVYFGVWSLVHYPGPNTPDRGAVRSHFATTTDGKTWSKVQGVYEPGFWLWRVEYHDGRFYSAAYTAVRPRPTRREVRLLASVNGLDWDFVSLVANEHMAGETGMWWQGDGSLRMITRTNDRELGAILSSSDPELTLWRNQTTGVTVHAPAMARWQNRVFVGGRGYDGNSAVTKLWEVIGDDIVERITLPSGGDTSYPGLAVDPATAGAEAPSLFVSWYSQHENDGNPAADKHTANIYVGRVTMPKTP